MFLTDTEFEPTAITDVGVSGLFDLPATVAPSGTTGLERFIYDDENCIIDAVFKRRMERVENCGKTWSWRRKKDSGVRALMPNYCDDYHYCAKCLNRRIYKLKKRLESTCLAGELYTITTTPADWRNMRKISPGAQNFYTYPQPEDTLMVFINQTMFDNLKHTKYAKRLNLVSETDFNYNLNWPELVVTTDERRATGKLGLAAAEIVYGEISERAVTITRDGVMVDDFEVQEIDNQAMDETAELDPHTIVELQVAMDTRTEAFIDAAKARGCTVSVQHLQSKLTIAPTSLHWLHSYTLIVAARKGIAERKRDLLLSWGVTNEVGT